MADLMENAGFDAYGYRGAHKQSIEIATQYYVCYGKYVGFKKTVTADNARACPDYQQYIGQIVSGLGDAITTIDDQYPVNALSVTPDGKTLASGNAGGTIRLRSLPDGKLLTMLTGHRSRVNALVITPDAKILASGGNENSINFWSLPGGGLVKALSGLQSSVNALLVTADGRLLASGHANGQAIFWDIALLPTSEPCAQAFLFDPQCRAALKSRTNSVRCKFRVLKDRKTISGTVSMLGAVCQLRGRSIAASI